MQKRRKARPVRTFQTSCYGSETRSFSAAAENEATTAEVTKRARGGDWVAKRPSNNVQFCQIFTKRAAPARKKPPRQTVLLRHNLPTRPNGRTSNIVSSQLQRGKKMRVAGRMTGGGEHRSIPRTDSLLLLGALLLLALIRGRLARAGTRPSVALYRLERLLTVRAATLDRCLEVG